MNIGDYVRTLEYIRKIRKIKDNYVYCDIGVFEFNEIIKSSPNIIDLIEVGDVIFCDNKKYAINYEFEGDYNDEYKDYEITIDDYITLFLKDGLSIVTKEQFESMEYKIGE